MFVGNVLDNPRRTAVSGRSIDGDRRWEGALQRSRRGSRKLICLQTAYQR
jgi:hypothetical protein